MSRIASTFAQLGSQKALIAYITAGDPNLATTLAMMHSMAENGADIIELGIPFSDPMADGPTIQRAVERALAQRNIDNIFLVAPTTSEARMQAIAQHASGFVYYVSLKGVTGSAELDTDAVAEKLALLRRHIRIPIGVGFGISDAASAAKIAAVADAVIVGSRIVREIEANPGREAEAVAALVGELKAAV